MIPLVDGLGLSSIPRILYLHVQEGVYRVDTDRAFPSASEAGTAGFRVSPLLLIHPHKFERNSKSSSLTEVSQEGKLDFVEIEFAF